ncbi:MAG: hypothetical protein ACTSUO_04175 [Candidatus Thorarchaeota archaeon]
MSQTPKPKNRTIQELAGIVDDHYSKKIYWGTFVFLLVLLIPFTSLLILISVLISFGAQAGVLAISDVIQGVIALIAFWSLCIS